MNTKNCPKCGKELPAEAAFCPYCMTKLIDVQTGTPIKVKDKNHILIISIIAAAVIITIAVCFKFLMRGSENERSISSANIPRESKSVNETEIYAPDLSKYIGIYGDTENSFGETAYTGGNILEIISARDDTIRFNFTKISSPPYNRIAEIDNVMSKITDGVGTFTFDDDYWGNKGIGKIILKDKEIYLEINITQIGKNAMWNIGGTVTLVPSLSKFVNIQHAFLQDFDEVKNQFGEEIRSVSSSTNDVHVYQGLTVSVDQNTNKITFLEVYYDNALSNYDYWYGTINGNSTYEDVYAEFGEPYYNFLSSGEVVYNIDGNGLKFRFDEDMNVISIVYQVSLAFAE